MDVWTYICANALLAVSDICICAVGPGSIDQQCRGRLASQWDVLPREWLNQSVHHSLSLYACVCGIGFLYYECFQLKASHFWNSSLAIVYPDWLRTPKSREKQSSSLNESYTIWLLTTRGYASTLYREYDCSVTFLKYFQCEVEVRFDDWLEKRPLANKAQNRTARYTHTHVTCTPTCMYIPTYSLWPFKNI